MPPPSPTVIDQHYDTYRRNSLQDDLMRRLTIRTFTPFFVTGTALELGCSDGYMTSMLSPFFTHIDVVEGSIRFLEEAQKRALPNVTFHHALFEAFETETRYDAIIASYMLTHVDNDEAMLAKLASMLTPQGRLYVVVPNIRVLSRQLALHMGFLQDLKALSENDHHHGHKRAYDRVDLNRVLEKTGFTVIAQGGILLKPLADFQMDSLIDQQVLKEPQLEGLYQLGLEYPDLASAIFAVCTA